MANSKWIKKPLKDLCTRIGDGLHGTPEYTSDTDIFFINGNNLKDGKIVITKDTNRVTETELENNYIKLNKNTLLLSINGTLGSMAFYNNEKVMLGKSAAYLNFKYDINRFYYYYFQLQGVQDYFYNVATGSTIKNLSLKSIQDFEVPVPQENEWKGIATVLSSIDAKIELNNKINQELEAMAKTLYDYWFVQFDFPNEQGKPYKSSGGKMVYNEELKREIPEGWEVGTLSNFVKIERGISYKSTELDNTGKSMVNLNSFYLDGSYKVEGIKYFTGNYNENKTVRNGELLIAVTDVTRNADIIGKSILLPNIFEDTILFSMDVAKITPNDKLDVHFLNMLFNSQPYHDFIKQFASGTLVLHLDLRALDFYKLVIPQKHILEKFSKFKSNIEKRKSIIIKENQQLTALRDWLLPMLMNGQVTIGEAEEKLSSSIEQSRNMAAEPEAAYKKG